MRSAFRFPAGRAVVALCGGLAMTHAPGAANAQDSAPALRRTDAGTQSAGIGTVSSQLDAIAAPGARPRFGAAPGSGAARTGYVSQTPSPAPGTAAPRAATSPPAQPGRPLPGALRQNLRAQDRVLDAAEARAERRRAERSATLGEAALDPETDTPFDPVGLRVGSFVLRPAIELSAGYDNNPLRTHSVTRGAAFTRVAPEFTLRSDWTRHALGLDVASSFTQYNQLKGNDRPELDARLRGRLDITDFTRLDGEARYRLTTEGAGDPDAPTGAVRPPLVETYSAVAGLVHRFNRFEIGLRGTADRVLYEDARLRGGGILDNADRAYDEFGVTLRGSYELAPGVRPFAEVRLDTRDFARRVDDDGLRRSSDGQQLRVGTSFELTRTLAGEIAGGSLTRRYDDPRLAEVSGLLVDSSLVWTASALTTVRLTGRTAIDETTVIGANGLFRREASVDIEHSFRRWLVGTLRFGVGTDDYRGTLREDTRYSVAGGLLAKIGRELWLRTELRHERLDSNLPATDYTANIVTIGLRFQR